MALIYGALMVCVGVVLMACTGSAAVMEWAQRGHKHGGKPGPISPADHATRELATKPTRFDVMG